MICRSFLVTQVARQSEFSYVVSCSSNCSLLSTTCHTPLLTLVSATHPALVTMCLKQSQFVQSIVYLVVSEFFLEFPDNGVFVNDHDLYSQHFAEVFQLLCID